MTLLPDGSRRLGDFFAVFPFLYVRFRFAPYPMPRTKRKEFLPMKIKPILSVVCASALAFSLAACGSGNDTGSNNTTVTGQITELSGTSVTLQLGELSQGEQPGGAPSSDSSAPSEDTASSDQSQKQTPPEKPDDDTQDSSGTPPEKPANDTSSQDGQKPDSKPDGQPGGGSTFTAGDETLTLDLSGVTLTKNGDEITTDSLAVGDLLTVTLDENNSPLYAEVVTNQGGPGGGSGEVDQGDSANTIDSDTEEDGATYTSTGDDENALRIDGAKATLKNITVKKSSGSSSSTEDGDFYGKNAALLATNGANVTIENANVTSSVKNGNGVFSYGSGTTVNISDSTITTTGDNSGGIQTTGGGTTNASNLTVDTSGNSAAAIRSDRGGGTVNVDSGSYTSHGYNSPAVYSTADITVKNAELTANNSEALVVEGDNSIALENCTVSGNMDAENSSSGSENVHAVMLYQSMSGDAEEGTASLSMTGGSLTGKAGDLFYITNTKCSLTLSGVTLTNEDSDGLLMKIAGNSASHGWGTAGANGAQVTCTADGQILNGDITVDTISTLDLTLKNQSEFTGTINIEANAQGGEAVDNNAVVTIEAGSTWTLTGDCVITSLDNQGTINFNGHTITLADGTVLSGNA